MQVPLVIALLVLAVNRNGPAYVSAFISGTRVRQKQVLESNSGPCLKNGWKREQGIVIPSCAQSISVRFHGRLSLSSSNEEGGTIKPTRRVCVAGGGFAGLNAALSLCDLAASSKQEVDVILLDPKERFVFLPLLYELAVGDATLDEVAPTYESLLSAQGTNLKCIQGSLASVDVEGNALYYYDASENRGDNVQQYVRLDYDALIVCTGTPESDCSSTPGAEKYATKFASLDDCYELRKELARVESSLQSSKLDVAVVGGGYSGVELSLNLMDRLKLSCPDANISVTLVHRGDEILANASDFNKNSAKTRLDEAGVKVLTRKKVVSVSEKITKGSDTVGKKLKEGTKELVIEDTKLKNDEKKFSMDADLLLWTAGSSSVASEFNAGALNSTLARAGDGKLITGTSLRVRGTTNVFALGDASKIITSPLPATAQVAIQQAPVAASNILTTMQNLDRENEGMPALKMLSFRYMELGEMMTLGTNDATVSSLSELVKVNGPNASLLRRIVYAARMPTAGQKLKALVKSSVSRVAASRSMSNGSRQKN